MKTWVYAYRKDKNQKIMFKGELIYLGNTDSALSFEMRDCDNPLEEIKKYIDISEFSKVEIKILNM